MFDLDRREPVTTSSTNRLSWRLLSKYSSFFFSPSISLCSYFLLGGHRHRPNNICLDSEFRFYCKRKYVTCHSFSWISAIFLFSVRPSSFSVSSRANAIPKFRKWQIIVSVARIAHRFIWQAKEHDTIGAQQVRKCTLSNNVRQPTRHRLKTWKMRLISVWPKPAS